MNTISITQAAASLGVSVKTMQRWDRDGVLLAGRTLTNRRWYSQEQLDSFRKIASVRKPR